MKIVANIGINEIVFGIEKGVGFIDNEVGAF